MSQLSLFEVSAPTAWTHLPFLVVDTETTGLNPDQHRVIELAWVLFEDQQEVLAESRLCSIPELVPEEITRITGINDSLLEGHPSFAEHLDSFLEAASQVSF